MEDCGYTWHFWAMVSAVVSFSFYGISNIYIAMKAGKKLGLTPETIKTENCEEAEKMIVDYLGEILREQGREFKETGVGCDSLAVLGDSRDIAELVKEVHTYGGRIVIRRVDTCDIEDDMNTALEVKKKLSDLDISRAKTIAGNDR